MRRKQHAREMAKYGHYWAIKILTQLATMTNLSATRPCFGFAAIKVYHTEIRGRL